MVTAKDGGSVLRREEAANFVRLLDWVVNETFVNNDGEEYSYRNICLRFQNDCFTNSHARFVAQIYAEGDQVRIGIFRC
jgi:hypothetical protein